MSDYLIKFNFRRPSIYEAVTWGNPREEINPVTPVDDPGKQLRTNINRIRCVYRANQLLRLYTSIIGAIIGNHQLVGFWTKYKKSFGISTISK